MNKPSYEIYCLYHNKVFPKYYGNQIDQITFVKMDKGPYVFPAKKHIHLVKEPWFKPIGKEWAEYEFYYSLYKGYLEGKVELPEYLGFIHYDMEFTSDNNGLYRGQTIINFVEKAFKEGIINETTLVAFQLYSIGIKSKKYSNLNILPLENISFFLDFLKTTKLKEKIFKNNSSIESFVGDEIPMSGAYFIHKKIFVEMVESFKDLLEEGVLKSYDKVARTQGLIAELYFAFILINLKNLKVINFHTVHHCLTFTKSSYFKKIIRFMGEIGYMIKNKNMRIYKILKIFFPDIKIK